MVLWEWVCLPQKSPGLGCQKPGEGTAPMCTRNIWHRYSRAFSRYSSVLRMLSCPISSKSLAGLQPLVSLEQKPSQARKGWLLVDSPHWSEMDLAVCLACVMS